jgi:hypothetical protein
MRTDLDECRAPKFHRSRRSGGKLHWLAHVFPPVLGVQIRPMYHLASHRRNHRHGGGGARGVREFAKQSALQRIHLCAVKGVLRRQKKAENAFTL